MVKSELIENLARRKSLTLQKAEQVVDVVFNAIVASLSEGSRVEIRGFGNFTPRDYKSYEGRNPKTGESITVPAKRLPFWRTGTELKARVDSAFVNSEKR